MALLITMVILLSGNLVGVAILPVVDKCGKVADGVPVDMIQSAVAALSEHSKTIGASPPFAYLDTYFRGDHEGVHTWQARFTDVNNDKFQVDLDMSNHKLLEIEKVMHSHPDEIVNHVMSDVKRPAGLDVSTCILEYGWKFKNGDLVGGEYEFEHCSHDGNEIEVEVDAGTKSVSYGDSSTDATNPFTCHQTPKTCGGLKALYKEHECCGKPNKDI